MFFAWDIEIEAGRSEDEPVERKLSLAPGVIVDGYVKFPRGCHGMVKVRILQGRFQIYPLSRGEWITGDAEAVPIERYYKMPKEPYELTFQGAAPDTDHPHTVTVRFIVLPEKVASMLPLIKLLTSIFGRMAGRR